MKRFVGNNYPPGSPLREVILMEKNDINDLNIRIAKGEVWMKLARLEEEIEYRVKDKFKYKYR